MNARKSFWGTWKYKNEQTKTQTHRAWDLCSASPKREARLSRQWLWINFFPAETLLQYSTRAHSEKEYSDVTRGTGIIFGQKQNVQYKITRRVWRVTRKMSSQFFTNSCHERNLRITCARLTKTSRDIRRQKVSGPHGQNFSCDVEFTSDLSSRIFCHPCRLCRFASTTVRQYIAPLARVWCPCEESVYAISVNWKCFRMDYGHNLPVVNAKRDTELNSICKRKLIPRASSLCSHLQISRLNITRAILLEQARESLASIGNFWV